MQQSPGKTTNSLKHLAGLKALFLASQTEESSFLSLDDKLSIETSQKKLPQELGSNGFRPFVTEWRPAKHDHIDQSNSHLRLFSLSRRLMQ